ncbi:hypothetical protein C0J52_23730 [Blattella germanica]|nr:hypothetical protein C0J52_23730 [Blattella germanica]
MLWERQNQEARELEKQHKEREKERERLERERERQEREKLERERERQEREKMERERLERLEQERQERDRLEKQRLVDQAVHKHFEESLRLAQQKCRSWEPTPYSSISAHSVANQRSGHPQNPSNRNLSWSLINSLPPPRSSGTEEDRKRAEHDVNQQQRLMAERLRQERYYNPAVQRTPSGGKVEYPPPAHSRVSGTKSDKPPSGHTVLPKAEPNFNLFGGYPYHPAGMIPPHDSGKVKQEQMKASPSSSLASLVTTKSASAPIGLDRERDVMLPNPPPLMSDIKNSVIVKNDVKSPHHPHDTSKGPSSHSSSPKLRVGDMVTSQQPHYLPPTSLSQHKAAYDYRSPNQSPHHIAPRHSPSPHHAHMTMEPQNLVGKGMQGHHRSNQQSSPHPLPHRQSPHTMQQQPHPSPPEQRYGSATGPNPLPYGSSKTATVGSYPYPSPTGHVTTTHYALATGGSVTAGSKPKVSSPAPPHIYGKPGITTGTPVCRAQDTNVNSGPLPLTSKAPHTSSVSPSPYQQMSPHHPPPPHPATAGPPPPAHSRGSTGSSMVGDHRVIYDRLYAGSTGHAVKPPSQHQGSSPPSASAAPHPNSRSSPLQIPHQSSSHHMAMTPVFQTQPLDLGVSSDRGSNRDDLSGSPKRKGVPAHHSPGGMGIDATKKRRSDQPNLPPQMLPQGLPALTQPLLSRVSEPSPLIASAATTITTVVNTAAYCTPAATTMMVSLSHEPSSASTIVTTSPSAVPARTESGDGSVRPSSTCSSPGVTAIFPTAQQQRNSPVPLAPPASSSSPNLTAQQQSTHTPVKPPQPPPSSVDSDKSNSPGPVRPTTGSSYPVHKLKKAWLQRHSGEDGMEDTTGIVGSGSCVTLPLNLGTSTPTVTGTNKETVNSGNSVSSLQNVGSLKGKTNSNKGNNRKGPSSVGSKDGIGVTLNGHASDIPSSKHSRPEDSSSSDAEREHKSPPKRKPPKMKRKKGGGGAARKAVEEKRKKLTPVTAHSESGSDSDKESVTDKDSDSGASTNQSSTTGKKSANGGGGSSTSGGGGGNKEPRKRGRRPKSSKNDRGEEPRQKKSRDDPPAPQRDPFRKPPVSQLKKTGESFLQDGPCHEVAPKLAKCRECRWTPNQRSKNMPNIFCRFYAFRRLRYTKNGQLAIAGFSDPHRDAAEEDLKLWLPLPETPPADLDPDMAKLLIVRVGDQFCDLLEQEKECLTIHMSEDKTIAWKRVVQGVREMCDVCETTLFNFHWACNKCGFVVCIDCYKGRKNGSIKIWGEAGKDRDDFSWLLCTNRQAHEQEKLMLTQIIAGDSLLQLGKKVHEVRALWGIPQYCGCQMSKESMQKSTNGICKDLLGIFKNEPLNGIIRPEKKEKDSEGTDEDEEDDEEKRKKKNGTANGAVAKQEDQNSPLNWLADVALSNEDKKACEDSGGSSSDSDEDKDGRYSTLRELLIRPSHKPNGSGSRSASPANNMTNLSSGGLNSNSTNTGTNNANNSANSKKSVNNSGTSTASNSNAAASSAGAKGAKKPKIGIDTLDEVISFVVEDKVPKEEIQIRKEELQISSAPVEEKPPVELKHYTRRYKVPQRAFPIPIRIMTQCESTELYPEIPHSWLCDGKLLRLNDPNLEGNYHIFQDMWKRGQPVIVSDVTKHLDMSLWHPESFIRDFGEEKNDLINCMTGNLVPNQPMRKFWEGFEHFSRRLKDERGNPMLLKLKDWPPGEDFAEMLPSRFSDLMKVLPLSEYTHRTGRLNLASRLPDCFVRPDLGPKMYNAYGSALYPSKGTTNLHLDISDAVNVMVYVGIPKDGNFEEHIKEAFRAIDEAGCDILTRRRVREKGELPGALWHIYHARDADKIRDLLNKVAIERGARLEPHHDPIHDQSWYLDGTLRERLYREYNVDGYAIVQCLGDSVFIPAGAPHQVRNLHNCIKVAEDFVSPENVSHCFHLTQEFRSLSDTHSNHEDKLQIKNIIYHAVKDSLSVLTNIARGSKRCKQFLANSGSGSAGGDNGTNGSAVRGETSPANGSNDDEEEANSRSPSNMDNLEIKKEIKKDPPT